MKEVILFSGGYDSMAVAIMNPDIDLLFIDYDQSYRAKEMEVVLKYRDQHRRNILFTNLKLGHDQERRNYYFLLEAKRIGYDIIYTGNRNILPWFDKYKDSNWFNLKIFAKLINIKIKMPVIGWSKRSIVEYCRENEKIITPYNCYHNNDDYKLCSCRNCEELRKLNYENKVRS